MSQCKSALMIRTEAYRKQAVARQQKPDASMRVVWAHVMLRDPSDYLLTLM